jgi:hypothetical protein
MARTESERSPPYSSDSKRRSHETRAGRRTLDDALPPCGRARHIERRGGCVVNDSSDALDGLGCAATGTGVCRSSTRSPSPTPTRFTSGAGVQTITLGSSLPASSAR